MKKNKKIERYMSSSVWFWLCTSIVRVQVKETEQGYIFFFFIHG